MRQTTTDRETRQVVRCMETEHRGDRSYQCDSYSGHPGAHSFNIDLTYWTGQRPTPSPTPAPAGTGTADDRRAIETTPLSLDARRALSTRDALSRIPTTPDREG